MGWINFVIVFSTVLLFLLIVSLEKDWDKSLKIILIILIFLDIVFSISFVPYMQKYNIKENKIQYDTLITIKNGVADTTITYQIKRY